MDAEVKQYIALSNELFEEARDAQQNNRYFACQTLLERCLEIREQFLGIDKTDTLASRSSLGIILHTRGFLQEAHNLHQQNLNIAEQIFTPNSSALASYLDNLGDTLCALGDFTAAYKYYTQSLKINEAAFWPEHISIIKSLDRLGHLFFLEENYSGASKFHEKALNLYEKAFGSSNPEVILKLSRLSEIAKRSGKFSQAFDFNQKAISIWEKVVGADHLDIAYLRRDRAYIAIEHEDYRLAERELVRTLQLQKLHLESDDPEIAQSHCDLGVVYFCQRDFQRALSSSQTALRMFNNTFGITHPATQKCQDNLTRIEETIKDIAKKSEPHDDNVEEETITCGDCEGEGVCRYCHGSGRTDQGKTRCYICDGTGECTICHGIGEIRTG